MPNDEEFSVELDPQVEPAFNPSAAPGSLSSRAVVDPSSALASVAAISQAGTTKADALTEHFAALAQASAPLAGASAPFALPPRQVLEQQVIQGYADANNFKAFNALSTPKGEARFNKDVEALAVQLHAQHEAQAAAQATEIEARAEVQARAAQIAEIEVPSYVGGRAQALPEVRAQNVGPRLLENSMADVLDTSGLYSFARDAARAPEYVRVGAESVRAETAGSYRSRMDAARGVEDTPMAAGRSSLFDNLDAQRATPLAEGVRARADFEELSYPMARAGAGNGGAGGGFGGGSGGSGGSGGGGGNFGGPDDFEGGGFGMTPPRRSGGGYDYNEPGEPIEADFHDVIEGQFDRGGWRSGLRGLWGKGAENLRKGLSGTGGAFGWGFSAMAFGQGFSQEAALDRGQYVSPEARAAAPYGMASGIGSVGGMALGAFFGGEPGAMAGQFIGQAGGAALEATVQAKASRDEATREGAERIAASLGAAATAVEGFRASIEATNAPAQQLGQVLTTLTGVGPVGPGAIAGAGAMTNALGKNAEQNYASVAAQLRDPSVFNLAQDFRQNGRLTAEGYGALGLRAAIEGDGEGLFEDNLAAQRSALADNPRYQAVTGQLNTLKQRGGWAQWEVDHIPFLRQHTAFGRAEIEQDAIQKRVSGTLDAGTTERNALLNQFGESRQARNFALTQITEAGSGVELTTLRGGSAADVEGASAGFYRSLDAAEATGAQDLARLRRELTDPKYQTVAPFLNQEIAQVSARQNAYEVQRVGRQRQNFTQGIEEQTSAFDFYQTRATLSGQSAAEMRGAIEGEAGYLSGLATGDNLLTQTERAGYSKQAAVMRYGAARAVDTEALNQIDTNIGAAGLGLTRAQSFGSPDAAFSAGGGVIEAYGQKIRELTAELDRGGLTVADATQKRQQLNQVESQSVQMQEARLQRYAADTNAVDEAGVTQITAGLSRAVRVGGTSAIDDSGVRSRLGSLVADDERISQMFPAGSRQRAEADARTATDRARFQDVEDSSNIFRQDARGRIQDIQGESGLRHAESQFRRAELMPYEAGSPEANPLTRGLAYAQAIDTRLGALRQDFGQETAFRQQRQGAGRWDELAEENYQRDAARYTEQTDALGLSRSQIQRDQMTAYARFLPEMIAGSPGRGIMAGIMPTHGQSSYFNSNPFTTGTFGPPDTHGTVSSPPTVPGGHLGNFFQSTGGAPFGGQASGSIERLLQDILHALQTPRMASPTSPAISHAGGYTHAQQSVWALNPAGNNKP